MSYLSPTSPVAAAHHFPMRVTVLHFICRLQLCENELQSVLLWGGKRRLDLQAYSLLNRVADVHTAIWPQQQYYYNIVRKLCCAAAAALSERQGDT